MPTAAATSTPVPTATPFPPFSAAEQEQARLQYDANQTGRVLRGQLQVSAALDACLASALGQQRLAALRAGTEQVSGRDNDTAAVCLLRLGISPLSLAVQVQTVASTYKVAIGITSGFFKTGQNADILLSGIDFNNTGGPLLFNHPAGIASDGTRLFLTDTFNNRVLIWNSLPKGNVAPDLVLGQKEFKTNNPGAGRDQLDWPMAVATDGKRLVVADTNNYRILIWNTIPTKNAQPADLVLDGGGFEGIAVSKSRFLWPWGVWTNGEKLAITSTGGGGVLIWNTFPTRDSQPADLLLKGGGKLGTPRHITSDGKSLIVGDHNARVEGQSEAGSFFWKTFPTRDDQPFDFYMSKGAWLRGTFAPDGKLLLMGEHLYIWNSFPGDATAAPDLTLQRVVPDFGAGDYENMVIAGNRLYVSLGNGNRVVVFNSIPTLPDQLPDFAIGSPDIYTNTLHTNFFVQNGTPASNGKSLFVSSDFDRKLYVWKNLPDQSGAYPDVVYDFSQCPCTPWDIALWGETLALAGKQGVLIWKKLPLNGESPDLVFLGGIGSVKFQNLGGVALDDRYLYLGDKALNKVYVWEGLPTKESEPKFVLDVRNPWILDSNGKHLAIATFDDHVAKIYDVVGLAQYAQPVAVGGPGRINQANGVSVAGGHLFIADGSNRVLVWRNIEDALKGKWPPDIVLGENDLVDVTPEIGRNKLFLPRGLAFDGSYLWVAEVKFSNRILRFSPSP